ncbi:hypothetical protein T637_08260 [Enterobacter hormaechei subsp. hoffmannii]|nr:hypothetical protein T637_08260 [Enterobacter hormaechei subsp. hoffmannii]
MGQCQCYTHSNGECLKFHNIYRLVIDGLSEQLDLFLNTILKRYHYLTWHVIHVINYRLVNHTITTHVRRKVVLKLVCLNVKSHSQLVKGIKRYLAEKNQDQVLIFN